MKRVGYVIANAEEEFLADFKSTSDANFRSWARVPDLAKVYSTEAKALKAVQKMALSYRVWVLELRENDSQFAVMLESNDRPPWMETYS